MSKKTIAEAGARLGLKPASGGASVIGLRDGFPVQLVAGDRVTEIVRYGDTSRDEEVRRAIVIADEGVDFQGSRLHVGNGLAVYQHKRGFFRTASPDRVATELEALVRAVKSAAPKPAEGCLRCGNASATEPILVDGVVDRVCASCVEQMQHKGKVASDRYDDLPMNLSLAVPAAAILALVSAVAWAGIAVATGRMFWMVAIGIGALIGWGTTKAAGKGGRPVQVIGAVFTVIAVLLGELFFIAWNVNAHAKASDMEVDWAVFASEAPEILMAGGGDTVFSLVGGLIGALYAIGRASKPKLQVSVERPGP